MCVCASESSRPRLFNWVTVMLVSVWVLIVSAVAHSFPGAGQGAVNTDHDLATTEAILLDLIDRLAMSISSF